MSEQDPDHRKLALRLFGHLKPDEIPPVDQVLRALEIAKGVKFRISPAKLAAIRTQAEASELADGPCGSHDNDWCTFCDMPKDICKVCDALDCGGDYKDVN